MQIDVYHDTVCPWCRIGKAHLDRALDGWAGPAPMVRYRPFFLNPDMPEGGQDFREYMSRLKGPGSLEPLFEHARLAGEAAGVTLCFDRVARAPNTLLSHRLLALAPEERQADVLDAIHRAYFEDGRDIGRLDTLVEIAAEAGLDASVGDALRGDAARDEVLAAAETARRRGVSGVPLFVFDDRVAVHGAQPAPVLRRALNELAQLTTEVA